MNNTTLTILEIGASYWWISIAWFFLGLTIFNLSLVNAYLLSKPLGSQTLLDKLYVLLFKMTMWQIAAKIIIDTVAEVEIHVNESVAFSISWTRFYLIEVIAYVFLISVAVNILLVVWPNVLDIFTDEAVFEISVVVFATVLGSLTTLLSYKVGFVPKNYLQLTQSSEPFDTKGQFRTVVFGLGVFFAVVLKLYLACTKRTMSEGENNLFSSPTIIIISVNIIIYHVLLKYVSFKMIPQAVSVFQISLIVILNKRQVRKYCFRHLKNYATPYWISATSWAKYLIDLANCKANRVEPVISII